jgi:hypothetical protein
MWAEHESSVPAPPAAVSGTTHKLRQLLRKRLRQLLRITFVVAICLALAAADLAVWWLRSLNGLPEIGEPFDVRAFRAFSVPNGRNAFDFLLRAENQIVPCFAASAWAATWSRADRKLREWVEANHPALRLFQQGPDKADAAHAADHLTVNGTRAACLAQMEGAKRQDWTRGLRPARGQFRAAFGRLTRVRRIE